MKQIQTADIIKKGIKKDRFFEVFPEFEGSIFIGKSIPYERFILNQWFGVFIYLIWLVLKGRV
ncbi:hypothetical protein K7I13_09790 [Brucepastera parasyntrophica]|uniref:hypothetical protein n=1 Tax=Brucepastera parasyntrophica TaxID=2880008 RepID=UPI00210E58C5|nr:hypothetical protein [Brucepastera parasyntrophica]ULQ58824.1 hypothetical protein K7I13_09790 [Brucepastera parasyntrophica]